MSGCNEEKTDAVARKRRTLGRGKDGHWDEEKTYSAGLTAECWGGLKRWARTNFVLVSGPEKQEIRCLARGVSRASLQGMVGYTLETWCSNAKGVTAWGVVRNGSDG